MNVLTESGNLVNGLAPVNAAQNTSSDIVNVSNYHNVTFLLVKGAGGVGTATITVDVCDDVTPSNTAKVGYYYRRYNATAGTWGTLTARTAAQSFATTAQANDMYEITVDTNAIADITVNGTKGHKYCRLNITQVDATACYHAVVVILGDARYGKRDPIDPLV